MDNLFSMRDIFDICKLYNINIDIIFIDKEKAFDCDDHSTLQTFGD